MTEDEVRAKAIGAAIWAMGYLPTDSNIQAMTKAIAAYEAAMWQPIETAPRQDRVS